MVMRRYQRRRAREDRITGLGLAQLALMTGVREGKRL
jgi:hypothetical protein